MRFEHVKHEFAVQIARGYPCVYFFAIYDGELKEVKKISVVDLESLCSDWELSPRNNKRIGDLPYLVCKEVY